MAGVTDVRAASNLHGRREHRGREHRGRGQGITRAAGGTVIAATNTARTALQATITVRRGRRSATSARNSPPVTHGRYPGPRTRPGTCRDRAPQRRTAALGCELAGQSRPLLQVGEQLTGHLDAGGNSWLNSSAAGMRPGRAGWLAPAAGPAGEASAGGARGIAGGGALAC